MTTLDKQLLDNVHGGGVLGPGIYMFGPQPTAEQLATWRACRREAGVNDWFWTWHRGRKCDDAFDAAVLSNKR